MGEETPASPPRQLADGAVFAPAAVARMGARSLAWLVIYLLLAGGVLFGITALVAQHEDGLRGLLLTYLLPTDWHGAARGLFDTFLADQARPLLRNALLGGAMLLVSMLLFPVKEALSKAFERDAGLTDAAHDELPLWMQGYEELKLLVVYVTGHMLLFRLAYGPDPSTRLWATWLSHGFLASTIALDFIAPVLQRHGFKYATVLRTLLRRPLAALAFGAVFAAPAIWVAQAVEPLAWTEVHKLRAVFGVQVLLIAWAALAGTWLGSRLLAVSRRVPPTPWVVVALSWVALLGLFGHNGYVFGRLGQSMHHKSQLLKCNYDVAWSTLSVDLPSIGSLLGPTVEVGVTVDLRIENPTPFDLVFEDTRLVVQHDGTPMANSVLDPFMAPAMGAAKFPLHFTLALSPLELARRGRALLDDKYALTLYVQIADGLEWPVYLRGAPPGLP
jgi:hypothetical protein